MKHWRVLDFLLSGTETGRKGCQLSHVHVLAWYLGLGFSSLEKSITQQARVSPHSCEIGFLAKRSIGYEVIFPRRTHRKDVHLDIGQFDIWYVGTQHRYVKDVGSGAISIPAESDDTPLTAACDRCSNAIIHVGWRRLGRVERPRNSTPDSLAEDSSLFMQGLPRTRENDIDSLRALRFSRIPSAGLLRANFESRPLRRPGWLLGSLFDSTEFDTLVAFLPFCNSQSCFQSELISRMENESSLRHTVHKPVWMDECQIS